MRLADPRTSSWMLLRNASKGARSIRDKPNGTDAGTDTGTPQLDPDELRILRGIRFAIILSIPIWIALIVAAVYLWRRL